MLTKRTPTKAGHYWWTDGFGGLQVVEVTELENGELYAQNEEVGFNLNICEGNDVWEYIKQPKLPKRKNLTFDDE